jgi:hypothetical protein
VQEDDALLCRTSMGEPAGRGRRDTGDGGHGPPQGADACGRIERSDGLQFGPSSVSSKRGDERESTPVIRVSSSSNMFAMVDSSDATPGAGHVGSRITALTRPPGRKASIDAGLNTASPVDGPRRDILVETFSSLVAFRWAVRALSWNT